MNNTGVGLVNPEANLVDFGAATTPAAAAVPTGSEPPAPAPSGITDAGVSVTPVVSSVPAYYVTVLGQMVPVFLEELQQAGQEVPSLATRIPAYFIVTQGQHVPVYSEEQARALNN